MKYNNIKKSVFDFHDKDDAHLNVLTTNQITISRDVSDLLNKEIEDLTSNLIQDKEEVQI